MKRRTIAASRGALVAVVAFAMLAPPQVASAAGLHLAVDEFLANPWAKSGLGAVGKAQRILVLSHFAEACVSLGLDGASRMALARDCVERLIPLAFDTRVSPYRKGMAADLGGHGLYLSHLAIMLGAFRRAGGGAVHEATHRRIADHLVKQSLSEPSRIISSYSGNPSRWPADQAATLHALYLYDQTHGTHIGTEPRRQWLAWMDRHGLTKQGLHRSEVTGRHGYSRHPRGCALSYTVRYLAAAEPVEARRLWDRFKESFFVDRFALVGLREYPDGVSLPADSDSGPIVHGIGIAASGLALGASRAVADTVVHARLVASAAAVKALIAVKGGKIAKMSENVLATAIELCGTNWRRW